MDTKPDQPDERYITAVGGPLPEGSLETPLIDPNDPDWQERLAKATIRPIPEDPD